MVSFIGHAFLRKLSRFPPHFNVPVRINAAEGLSSPVILGLSGLLFASVLFGRCPATILHPEFWAEDGMIWYADAYTVGWHSMFFPQNGYLQTLSRLVAVVAQAFPLLWAPGIFVAVALVIQTLTATFLVSGRMSSVWPSLRGRLLFALIYVALPNSFETHLNLTNTQWHLAILAFLVLVSRPTESRLGRAGDVMVLALSGLSGPFCILLLPIAIWQLCEDRGTVQLQRAAILAMTCLIQSAFLIETIRHARSTAPLGARGDGLARIFVVQVLLGGLLGVRVMSRLSHATLFNSGGVMIAVAIAGLLACAVALKRGPPVLQKAALFGALVLAAALWRPQVDVTLPQWSVMTNPGAGQRYYLLPILVWIGVALTHAADPNRALRHFGSVIILGLCTGIAADWFYPELPPTDFTKKAGEFAFASPGTRMEFALRPPGWAMTLTKQSP